MTQVQAGRVERLAVIFERHHLHLFNFFLRMTRHKGNSEDLVQEVFVRLLRYKASYRPGAPFLPWMWRIARNVLYDHSQDGSSHVPLDDCATGVPDQHAGAEAALIQCQEQEHLEVALGRLEPAKRELLLLSRDPDLPYKELAAMMSCSVGALKVQVHRALKELKAVYLELNGGVP